MRFFAAVGTIFLVLACWLAPAMAADQSVSGALTEVLHSKGVIDDATYSDLKNAQAAGGDKALNEKLVEVLHNKGVIDDATYQSLSAQAKAAPAPVATAPQASTAAERPAGAAERPLDKTLSSLEEGFARLSGDTVKLKIGTWTQLGWANDSNGHVSLPFEGSSGTAGNTGNSFYVRFARIYFTGQLSDKVGFRVTFDGVGPTLQDAFFWADYIPYTRVTLGQFLTPFGDETWRAPFDIPMINYSLPGTFMQFTNLRDQGVMVAPKFETKVAGLPFAVAASTALVNSNSSLAIANTARNTIDDNDFKDWIGRATITPLVPGLSMGGSWFLGKTTVATANPRITDKHDSQRWGAEMDYAPPFLKGLALRGEYLFQRKWFTDTSPLAGSQARYVHSSGWYAQASYRLTPLPGFLSNLEPKFRYEWFDEDMARGNNSRTRTTVGLNYWLNKYTRLLADYEWVTNEAGIKTFNLDPNFGTTNHQVLTTNVQIWF